MGIRSFSFTLLALGALAPVWAHAPSFSLTDTQFKANIAVPVTDSTDKSESMPEEMAEVFKSLRTYDFETERGVSGTFMVYAATDDAKSELKSVVKGAAQAVAEADLGEEAKVDSNKKWQYGSYHAQCVGLKISLGEVTVKTEFLFTQDDRNLIVLVLTYEDSNPRQTSEARSIMDSIEIAGKAKSDLASELKPAEPKAPLPQIR